MKSEEEKYLETVHKAHEFVKAFGELKPESQQRLIQEIMCAASLQEVIYRMQAFMMNNNPR